MKRVNLELPDELLVSVDKVRGDVPRNRWIRRILMDVLSSGDRATADLLRPYRERPSSSVPGPNVENVRPSAQAKRDTRPYPKGARRGS